jgi:thiosulfate dehydrogenase [quinone] large subunit
MLDQRTIPQTTYDWQAETRVEPIAHREIAYALLRVTLSMVFLVAGIGKFMMGIGVFAASLQQEFAGKLPMALVTAFAYALPFAEVLTGALLLLGLFNVAALALAGLMMIALTFGTAMKPDPPTMAHNVSYGLVIFVLLWLARYNGYSLDRLRAGGRRER